MALTVTLPAFKENYEMLCRKQLIYNLPTLKISDLYGFGDDVKIGKCKEFRSDCESSPRSLEKIRPSCLLSCLLSPIKDASFEGMKHLKIITFRQSSDAEPLLRKDSEDSVPERNQCICLLESGCEKIQMQPASPTVLQ